jgi:hypothetical protein
MYTNRETIDTNKKRLSRKLYLSVSIKNRLIEISPQSAHLRSKRARTFYERIELKKYTRYQNWSTKPPVCGKNLRTSNEDGERKNALKFSDS